MPFIHFLLTFGVWLCSYLILIPISFLVVPIMLKKEWDGTTTLFGNRKYGRLGNKVFLTNGKLWREWWFLCMRNPISNFGKETMSVSSTAKWPWHYDFGIFRLGSVEFHMKYGWKPVLDPVKNPDRTFVFRPYFEITNNEQPKPVKEGKPNKDNPQP